MLKKNMGTADRVIRIVLGVLLLGAFFVYPEVSFRWLLLIGIVPLVTGVVGSCPLYSLVGTSTNKT